MTIDSPSALDLPATSPLPLSVLERARATYDTANASLITTRMLLADASRALPKIERQAIITIAAAKAALGITEHLSDDEAAELTLLSESVVTESLAQVRLARASIVEWTANVASARDTADRARASVADLLLD